jgi:hypothetical protein
VSDNHSNNHPQDGDRGSEIVQFSFWKPDPIPPKNAGILPIELHSLGSLNSVAEKLMEVPHMARIPTAPWDQTPVESDVRLLWEVEGGVVLKVHLEEGPPKPGEVLTINARSHAPQRIFYRLYVQIFEQFGATLLDEKSHEFYTPREFRTKMAG